MTLNFRAITRSLLSTAYGLPAKDAGKRFVQLLNEIEDGLTEAYSPTVLALPWLRRLPAWCPGGYWQRQLVSWMHLAHKALELPFAAAQDAMVTMSRSEIYAMYGRVSNFLTGPRQREASDAE